MQPKQKERRVYWGVVTPKGEPNSKKTYYFQECQLQQLAKDIVGLPVKISHNHVLKNGEKSPAAGIVIQGHVHTKTGDVWAGFVRSDNLTGELAGSLLGEDDLLPPELQMGELSLGFDILTDTVSGDPKGHRVKELSICYNAARPGCQIRGSTPYSTLLLKEQPRPPVPAAPPVTYNPKIFGGIINKYIRETNSKKEEEKMDKLMAVRAPVAPRQADGQTLDDVLNGLQSSSSSTTPAGGVDTIISTKASANVAVAASAVDEEISTLSATLERALAQKMSQKRALDESSSLAPPTLLGRDKRHRLDFSKYINGSNQDFKEPTIPDDLPEQHKQLLRDSFANQKELWAKNNELEKAKRRGFLERIQQASDNSFIPTYIEKLAAEDKELDKVALEAMMVAPLEYSSPDVAERVVQFLEAQAKQGVDNDALRKDINQREKEYQENLRKLAEENSELRKSQARPPMAPITQQQRQPAEQTVIPAIASAGSSVNFKEMGRFERVVNQAGLRANQRAPNLPGNKMPMDLIRANGKRMQALWDSVDPLQGRQDDN